MSSSAPIKSNDANLIDDLEFVEDSWSTVSKRKIVKSRDSKVSASSPPPASTCWASLFETPRASPPSRPKSPEKDYAAALNVIASVEPITVSWKNLQVPCSMLSRGIINQGNMCFLNSILQSLIHCCPFANLVKAVPLRLVEALDTPYLLEFSKLFVNFYQPLDADVKKVLETISAVGLIDVIRCSNTTSFQGDQEDAQEFLTFILDSMHQEFSTNQELMNWEFSESTQKLFTSESVQEEDGWLEVGPKQKLSETRSVTKIETPISFLFSGQYRSVVKRVRAKESIVLEPFNCLQLEVHHRHINSIEDGLLFLSRPEIVDQSISKYITIGRLPMILIIQLKRFVYQKETNGVEKVQKFISYPERLIIPEKCYSGHQNANQPTYRLTSVVYHHGRHVEGGHYTADVRKSFKQDELWEHFDDTNISKFPLEKVLSEKKSDCSAYLLFYQRTKDTKHPLQLHL